jgi:hypothetical protein
MNIREPSTQHSLLLCNGHAKIILEENYIYLLMSNNIYKRNAPTSAVLTEVYVQTF